MPGDNIYPDLSNSQFDIQYARLMGLPSDLRATLGVIEELPSSVFPGNPPVFETPSDDDTGQFRFAVAAEDNIAAQHRAFDLAGAYKFEITQLGNVQFIVDPTNGLYQLGAVPVIGSDSVLSYTYLEIDDTTRKIKLQAAEGIVLPGYGVGAHLATPAYSLGVDAGGNLIEFVAGVGATMRFGFAGEDDAATTESRTFNANNNNVSILDLDRILFLGGIFSASNDYARLELNKETGSSLFEVQVGNTSNEVAAIYAEAGYGIDLNVGTGSNLFIITNPPVNDGTAADYVLIHDNDDKTVRRKLLSEFSLGGSDDWQDTLINGSTLTQDNSIAGGGFTFAFTNGRFTTAKGADVASANDLTVGGGGNTFRITGTTTINALTIANWQDGSDVFLVFDSALTVKHGTVGGAGTAQMLLAGSEDLITDANTILHLKKTSSTTWEEIGRKQSTIIGNVRLNQIKAANGSNIINNANFAQEWQWNTLAGGTALKLSTTSAAVNNLQKMLEISLSGANTNAGETTYGIYISNTHTGTSAINGGVFATTSGTGRSIWGFCTGSGNAGRFENNSTGISVFVSSSTGTGIDCQTGAATFNSRFLMTTALTTTTQNIISLQHQTSGTAAVGFGPAIHLQAETNGNVGRDMCLIGSKWSDALDATRQSTAFISARNINDYIEKLNLYGHYSALTEGAATAFLRVNTPTGQVTGGEIIVTVEANDATDYQARTLRFIWAAVNKSGTTTVTISTPEEVAATSTGTLTATVTAVDAGSGNIDFKIDATSSLTQTTLRCNAVLMKNFGTGVITPQN